MNEHYLLFKDEETNVQKDKKFAKPQSKTIKSRTCSGKNQDVTIYVLLFYNNTCYSQQIGHLMTQYNSLKRRLASM